MAAAADSLQAQHLRQCLSEERVELAAKLAKHAKILTESIPASAVDGHMIASDLGRDLRRRC